MQKFLAVASMKFFLPTPARTAAASLFFLSLFPARAFAEECGWSKDNKFYSCRPTAGPASGSAAPLLSDTVEDNPAGIPVVPTKFGLEGRADSRQAPSGKAGFGGTTVKGFSGFGFGLGSGAYDSFAAPDIASHFIGSTSAAAYDAFRANPPGAIGLRLGSALGLPSALFPAGIHVSLGGSLGLGGISANSSPQIGLQLRIFSLGLGFSTDSERLTALLPRVTVSRYSAGWKLTQFYAGFSHISLTSSAGRSYSNEAILRSVGKIWILFGSIRWEQQADPWTRAGFTYQLGTFAIGYEYGEYRYAHSLIVQANL
jgi:hypothetical protein